MNTVLKGLRSRGFTIVHNEEDGDPELHYRVSADSHYWLTTLNGFLPETMDDSVRMGFYWNVPYDYRTFEFDTFEEAIAWIENHADGVERVHSDAVERPMALLSRRVLPGTPNDDPGVTNGK